MRVRTLKLGDGRKSLHAGILCFCGLQHERVVEDVGKEKGRITSIKFWQYTNITEEVVRGC